MARKPGVNFFEFSEDLDKFAKVIGAGISEVRRKVSFALYTNITRRTPVDTGRLRASWFMSDAEPAGGTAPEGQRSGGGATQEAFGNVTATFAKPYDTTWIVNNLPYAGPIEFGHSSQAPAGMVRISLAEVEAEVRAMTLDNKK